MPIRKGKFETPEEALERKDKEKIHKAAVRGAKYLDKERPDWVTEVDLDLLSMEDENWCILGQTYGYFNDGIQELFGFDVATEDLNGSKKADRPAYYGFSLADVDRKPYLSNLSYGALWDVLAEKWKALIRERLGAGNV